MVLWVINEKVVSLHLVKPTILIHLLLRQTLLTNTPKQTAYRKISTLTLKVNDNAKF